MAGTTVRDGNQVLRAFAAALAEIGVQITTTELTNVRGSSKREAVRRFVPDTPDRDRVAASAYSSFRDHLTRLYRVEGIQAIDGAEESFASLRRRNVKVALNTGFDREITDLLLTTLGWNDAVIDAVVCGDEVSRGRPAPDLILQCMERTGVANLQAVMNVGDTVLDLRAGHAAGVRWNVGVLSGAHDRRQLEQAPHTHLVDSIRDLTTLF